MAKKATGQHCEVQKQADGGCCVTRRYVGSAAAEAVVLALIRAHSAGD